MSSDLGAWIAKVKNDVNSEKNELSMVLPRKRLEDLSTWVSCLVSIVRKLGKKFKKKFT